MKILTPKDILGLLYAAQEERRLIVHGHRIDSDSLDTAVAAMEEVVMVTEAGEQEPEPLLRELREPTPSVSFDPREDDTPDSPEE